MFFPALVSWNVVWLPSLGVTRFLFVCFLCVFFWLLLFTPISATFLSRSACVKFNADGFIFNHSKQNKNINYRGMRGPLALKTFLDKQT